MPGAPLPEPKLAQLGVGAFVTSHMCFDSRISLKQLSEKNKAPFSTWALVADLERVVFVKCVWTGHL